MQSSKEEDDKSNYLIKRLKNNINRTMYQPERFKSAFKQRPFTTFKTKPRDFEGKTNLTKNNFYVPKLNRDVFASKYSTFNLYQNKHSFIWGRNQSKKNIFDNKYYAKEELADKVMKLKKALIKLNTQNNEQKIILYKQKKQLKKQNQILNQVKEKYFFENFYKNIEGNMSLDNFDSNFGNIDNDNKISKSNPKQKSKDDIRSLTNEEKNNNNPETPNNLNYLSNSNLKELCKKLEIQNEKKDKEILLLKEQLEHNKFSNEAYLSNIKMQYKQLKEELNKKNEELNELKKNSKCTKYNEIMKEKEIYENEMINIKSRYNKAMEAHENYKICLKRMKYLIEEINIKDTKIEYLENKLKVFIKASEDNVENLKNEINKKNKKIIKLENEKKKLNIKVNTSAENKYSLFGDKKEAKELLCISKNNNFMIKANNNKKEQEIKSEKENNEEILKEEKKKDKYINHNMNFSSNTNNIDILLNQKDNEKNKNVEENKESKNINIEKEQVENNENQNNDNNEEKKEKEQFENKEITVKAEFENKEIKNENFNEIMNLNIELLLMYIELTKKNINFEAFINEIFSKLNQENAITDNKKIYAEYLIDYFKILDNEGKKIIEDLSNKEFEENKTLENIKNNHIQIFNIFNNEEKEEKLKEEEFKKKLGEIDENNFQNIILKYDDIQSGLVYFNQVLSIIKEINIEEYMIQILLLTKDPEVFNLFNYQNLLNIINKKEEKLNNNEPDNLKKESEIINQEQEQEQENNKEEENKNKNNESSSSKKYEGEFDFHNEEKNSKTNEHFDNSDDINKLESEKVLKTLAHFIVIEGSTPNLYISNLKEELKEENKIINVINSDKLFEFIQEKKIEINEKEKEEIIKKYGIENNDLYNEKYIDHDKFTEKLFELMKNDDGISNDDDFMKNIKSLEIDGID